MRIIFIISIYLLICAGIYVLLPATPAHTVAKGAISKQLIKNMTDSATK